ncbi:hypothetical protein QTP88_021149 [Uroleucon formosanum]
MERFKAEDSARKEKLVAYAVRNAMKAKRKIGMSCKRKRVTKNNGILAAKKKNSGLSALGSLMSGGANVYNAVQNSKRKKEPFEQ